MCLPSEPKTVRIYSFRKRATMQNESIDVKRAIRGDDYIGFERAIGREVVPNHRSEPIGMMFIHVVRSEPQNAMIQKVLERATITDYLRNSRANQ